MVGLREGPPASAWTPMPGVRAHQETTTFSLRLAVIAAGGAPAHSPLASRHVRYLADTILPGRGRLFVRKRCGRVILSGAERARCGALEDVSRFVYFIFIFYLLF